MTVEKRNFLTLQYDKKTGLTRHYIYDVNLFSILSNP
jgi:hypothetical protein